MNRAAAKARPAFLASIALLAESTGAALMGAETALAASDIPYSAFDPAADHVPDIGTLLRLGAPTAAVVGFLAVRSGAMALRRGAGFTARRCPRSVFVAWAGTIAVAGCGKCRRAHREDG